VELIIGGIALWGLDANVLATAHGVADVKLRHPFGKYDTGVTIGTYTTDVTMTTSAYVFDSKMSSIPLGNYTNTTVYSYERAYKDACENSNYNTSSTSNGTSSSNCDLRYAIWKWTEVYLAMGCIACAVILFTGFYVLTLGCCSTRCRRRCCRREGENRGCCKCCCLISKTTELVVTFINLFVGILFAFGWAIIVVIKYKKDLGDILANEINDQLNNDKQLYYYDFTFDDLKAGESLWPLAAASILALVVTLYMLLVFCCRCCCLFSHSHVEEEKVRNEELTYEMLDTV